MFPTKLQLGKKITKEQLEKEGIYVSGWASDILFKVKFGKKREVELVVKSVGELGFTGLTRYEDICKKIIELGYELCPAEVGLALRLAYKDQPKYEWLWVAMEPIADADRGLRVFFVAHGGHGLFLDGDHGYPDTLDRPGSRFVCVMPRKFGTLGNSDSGNLDG